MTFVVFAFFLVSATGCNNLQNRSGTPVASSSPSASPSPAASSSPSASPSSDESPSADASPSSDESPSADDSPSSDESPSADDTSSSADPQKLQNAKVAVRLLRQQAQAQGIDPENFDLLDEDGVNFLQTAEKYCQALETDGAKKVATDLVSVFKQAKSKQEQFLTGLAIGGGIGYACPKYKDEFVKELQAVAQ